MKNKLFLSLVIISFLVLLSTVFVIFMDRAGIFLFEVTLEDKVVDSLDKAYKEVVVSEGGLREDHQERNLEDVMKQEDPFSFLLIGRDARGYERGRSDALIFGVVRPEEKSVLLVSIPRDTYVSIEGYNKDKINHAYAFGKERLTIETVQNYLDTPVDYYATIDFAGFKAIVDQLGGIPLPLKYDLKSNTSFQSDIFVPGGKTLYNGDEVLQYARFRADSQGDVGRANRHQIVIQSLLNRMKSLSTVTKVDDLIRIVGDYTQTNMQSGYILSLMKWFVFSREDLSIQAYTLKGTPIMMNGVSYYDISTTEKERVIKTLHEWLDPRIKSLNTLKK